MTAADFTFVPMSLRNANRFVSVFHRHNKPVQGAKFAVGLLKEGELVGVAIAGRPVARLLDDGKTIEISRVCVKEGIKNANSALYGRAIRICRLMGYTKVITYTLETESGSSLRAVGMEPAAGNITSDWRRKGRPRTPQRIYSQQKIRWEVNP